MRHTVAAVLFLLVTSCSSGSGQTTSTTVPTTTTTSLGAADVYAAVSPSLAFVETPIGSGSAVLIDSATLVTNAHVVWPDDRVSVTFPGGVTSSVPVVGYDWIADLALLDVSGLVGLPAPVELHVGAVDPGTAVYLVGYPADDPDTASPAITAGIVSRTRAWAEAGVTFIQADALISGGQSGGALVDSRGRVVGISGLSVGDGFALALTAQDVTTRIARMRAGDDPGLGARSPSALTGPPGAEGAVAYLLDEVVFTFDGAAGDSVGIEIRGSEAFNADLVGPDGFVEATTDTSSVTVTLEAELVLDGPYFVVVYPDLAPLDQISVAGVPTRLWADPDHGVRLTIGERRTGNGDYPGDLDLYLLDLVAGQTVTITASSINIDPSILVDVLDPAAASVFVSDSDSGGGVLGFDSELVFTAPATATYAVAVFDETAFGPGGYVVEVTEGGE